MAKIEDCPGFETFGADVKAARKAKQLSRSALADMIHCDSRYLANIENEGTLAQPAGGDSADKNMRPARGAVLQPGTHAGRKCGASEGQPQAAALPGRILTYRRRCH